MGREVAQPTSNNSDAPPINTAARNSQVWTPDNEISDKSSRILDETASARLTGFALAVDCTENFLRKINALLTAKM